MNATDATYTAMIDQALGAPLKPGEMGVLLARAGVGKTACLTHIALDALLQDKAVLHVCIDEVPDKIKIWYREILSHLTTAAGQQEQLTELLQQAESKRFIMSFLHRTFEPDKFEQSILNVQDQVQFQPDLVIIDGFALEQASRKDLDSLRGLAQKHGFALWMSGVTHRHQTTVNPRGVPYPCHEVDDLFQAILLLEPQAQAIRLVVLKHYDQYRPEHHDTRLSPQTFLLLSEEAPPSS